MIKPLRATGSRIARIKQLAKQRHRQSGVPHHETLEQEARAAGFSSWHALLAAAGTPRSAEEELPVDPRLPKNFDQTANELRSKAQLREWWDRPFALTREDGRFDVRCLDGGAWDRSTFYGTAATLEDARTLARRKLRRWQHARSAPIVYADESGAAYAVRPPLAGQSLRMLMGPADIQEVRNWIEAWRRANPEPDDTETN